MELSDYRQQIDGIDSQLLALFYQRMEVAAQIAGYKKAHNLPALDAGRERAKLCSFNKFFFSFNCFKNI